MTKPLPRHVEAARVKALDETEAEHERRQAKAKALGIPADELVPGGGMTWEAQARMAKARQADPRLHLNDRDREALRRFPNPTGWVGETLK